MDLQSTILILQIIGTLLIVATLVVYYFQLKTMQSASKAQNILSLINYLQTNEVRDARAQYKRDVVTNND
jgi:hypothetical protein